MSTSLLRGVICVAFVFLHAQGSLEVGLSVDYVPLDGDALYEFLWAGSSAAARAEDVALLESLEGVYTVIYSVRIIVYLVYIFL